MDREATERNLQEMRDFSKQQKISYAKMAREQEDREKRLEEKERALELKRRQAEDLLEEAKRVAERREVREDDPDYNYYVAAAAEAEARLHPVYTHAQLGTNRRQPDRPPRVFGPGISCVPRP